MHTKRASNLQPPFSRKKKFLEKRGCKFDAGISRKLWSWYEYRVQEKEEVSFFKAVKKYIKSIMDSAFIDEGYKL